MPRKGPFSKLNKSFFHLKKYFNISALCISIGLLIVAYIHAEGFQSGHPHPHPRPHPHRQHPHPRPHPHRQHPHHRPHPHQRRWWDVLTFSWVPSFIGTCKNGCSYLGKGSWGCTYPGYGSNDCVFASDCRWCGNYV
jgi:hypothetical protein